MIIRAPTNLKKGFTLVELIVVIAILGILAGVAIPAYNGYIQKAREAADQQLLSAVNTAFAAACAENGVDPKGLTVDDFDLSSNKKIDVTHCFGTSYDDAFLRYYADNEAKEFSYYTGLTYNSASGVFVGSNGEGSGGTKNLSFTDKNGKTIYYTQESVDAYLASNYSKKDATVWTGAVKGLADTLGNQHDVLTSLLADETFSSYLTGAKVDADNDKAVANALVTFTAHTLSEIDVSSAGLNGNYDHDLAIMKSLISPGKEPSYAQKAAAAAFLYALSGGYASSRQSRGDTHAQDIFNNPDVYDAGTVMAYMNNLDQAKYASYLASDEGKADLDGMVSAMSLVNANETQLLAYLGENNNWNFSNGNIVDVIREILKQGTTNP